jgi:type VI secretion system protein ImpK
MTPKFAQAVDPVFLYAFDLLDRISRGEWTSPEQERLKLHGHLDVMESAIEAKADAELARYRSCGPRWRPWSWLR